MDDALDDVVDSASAYRWKMGDPCPCGCSVSSTKISFKTGHVRGCKCPRCVGRRNRSKGQAAQAKVHRALGGTGPTPTHEETARTYEVAYVHVIPEVKTGDQISRWLLKGFTSDWFRRALRQSERAIPVGTDARPAVFLKPTGDSGGYLVVRFDR